MKKFILAALLGFATVFGAGEVRTLRSEAQAAYGWCHDSSYYSYSAAARRARQLQYEGYYTRITCDGHCYSVWYR